MAWSQTGDRPGLGHQAPYKARACSLVGTRAGRTGLFLFFPSGTGFPVGLTVESLDSGVQDVPAGLDLGQQGSPLASPAKANTGNAKETSVSGHLIYSGWLGAPTFLSSAVGRPGICAQTLHRPGPVPQENTGKQSGDQQAAKGVRRRPGRRPPCCCQDPVSRPCTAF